MILESLSIAIIIPFLSFIIDGDINNIPFGNYLTLMLDFLVAEYFSLRACSFFAHKCFTFDKEFN